MTRWSLVISDEIDKNLRQFLGQQGAKKGDLSKFVEQAVKDKLHSADIRAIQGRNATFDQKEIMETVDQAVAWSRARRS